MNFAQILQNSLMNDENKYKSIVKDNTQLKKTKYDSGKFDFSSCPITMEDFKEGDDIICLPCKHIFEPNAIENWVTNENASCPVCRFKLESKKVKVKDNTNSNSNSNANSNANSNTNINSNANANSNMESVLNTLTGFMNNNLSIIGDRDVNELSTNEIIDINRNFNHIIHILRNRNDMMDLILNREIQEEDDNDLQMAIMASLNN